MITPQMPGIPGVGSMTDTLDFVKNIWSMMGVTSASGPGMVVPTLSVEELDKKIGDLKAVESWLNVNMNMLRGTIQALEVQRATIATLKSMGESFSEAVNKSRAAEKTPNASSSFSFPDFSSMQASKSAPKPPMEAERPSESHHAKPAPPVEAKKPQAAPEPGPQLANPAAWWNVLQDQFKQAVSTAMTSETASASKPAATAALKKTDKASTKKMPPRATAKPKTKTAKPKPAAT